MFLSTCKVGLRPIEYEDLATLKDWRNNPEVRKRVRESKPLNMANQERWWNTYADGNNIMFIIQCGPDMIGVCGLTHIDWKNRSAELSWYMYDGDYRAKDTGKHIVYLVCEYCFTELGLHKLWGEEYLIDKEIMPMCVSLGFTVDGIIRDTYWWDGKWHPSTFVSILDNEWAKMRMSYLKGAII